jgi:hypothetical protein
LFQPLKSMLADWGVTGMRGYYVSTWLGAYCNLAQMAVWVGGFVLLYLGGWRRALDWFVPLGRMSLTAYVTQAMFFVPFFYGYGLGLYRHLGQFHSVLCGLAFIVVQTAVAKLWLRHFQYGPLEWLWRAGTNRTFRTPFGGGRRWQPPCLKLRPRSWPELGTDRATRERRHCVPGLRAERSLLSGPVRRQCRETHGWWRTSFLRSSGPSGMKRVRRRSSRR